MAAFLFHGGRFLDPRQAELRDGIEVLVEDDRVKEVSDRPIASAAAIRVDLGGRTLMPGLIDAHVHMFMNEMNIGLLRSVPVTYVAAKGAFVLNGMLMRGYTTVRDVSGGDHGMKAAGEAGYIDVPRLFVSGRGISQTGGHGDFRERTDSSNEWGCCSGLEIFAVVADGVDQVIRAVRDELRKGADHIKIMVSGGVASPNDPLESIQFRLDEIAAAVDEATRWGTYVAAHAYSNESIKRAVSQGVRTIEHGNMVADDGIALILEKGAFVVPTLIAHHVSKVLGPASGKSPGSLKKNEVVYAAGLSALDRYHRAGVPIGYGTDLSMHTQSWQGHEFIIRSEVMKPHEIVHSATIVNARIIRREGEVGELVPGAFADLLVVDGDPYSDLGVFQDQGTRLAAIMKGGQFYKNRLA